MSGSPKQGLEENTFIKAYEDLEKSGKTPIRGPEAFPLVEIVNGPKQGAWFTVAYQKEITLGRASTNSIVLEDNSVSRSHAVLQASGNGFTVRDIGSRNGTFLNNKKIQEETPVEHLDVIKLGIYTLRFLKEPTEEAFQLDAKEEHTPPVEAQTQIGPMPEEPASEAEPEAEAEAPEMVEEAEELPVEADSAPAMDGDTSNEVLPEAPPPTPVTQKSTSKAVRNLMTLLLILVVLGALGYMAHYLGAFKKLQSYLGKTPAKVATKPEKPATPPVKPPVKPETPPTQVPQTPPAAQQVTAVLEADALPIPAKVFYQGKELGLTPFKINVPVPAGQPQELSAEFFIEGIEEKWIEKATFQAQKTDEAVSVKFQPKWGAFRLNALPKNSELIVEGSFEANPSQAKSYRLSGMTLGSAVYLPYGKYRAEVRVSEAAAGAPAPVPTPKFRQDFTLNAATPEFALSVSEDNLKSFPAKLNSTPPGAELWLDGKKIGQTPFEGKILLGSHKLILKKEGFGDLEKEISIGISTPYEATYNLMTSPAGEFVNKGREFLKKGQYNEAIEQLAEALKRNPEATELSQINMLLGEAFLQNKTYDQALTYFQKAKENPEYAARANLGIAEAQAGSGQKDQALIGLVDTVFNTKDEKLRSQAQTLYGKLFPMKSVLYVATEPPGASIQVNGNTIGQVTPVILSDLMVGSYRVSIQKDGFKPFETRISLPPTSIKPVIVKMQAQ